MYENSAIISSRSTRLFEIRHKKEADEIIRLFLLIAYLLYKCGD